MSDDVVIMLMALMMLNGIIFGYITWAPETPFKQGFCDALSLRFLWGRLRR